MIINGINDQCKREMNTLKDFETINQTNQTSLMPTKNWKESCSLLQKQDPQHRTRYLLSSEILKNTSSREMMVILTRPLSTDQWKSTTSVPGKLRAPERREKRSKVFIWTMIVPKVFIQGNCGRKKGSLKKLLVVCTCSNTTWTDKVTMKERIEYGPKYVLFD